jgi:predicted transcriptional regulator
MTGGRKMEVEGFESLKKALDEASKNARLRDLKTEQVLSREEMELVNELQAKANARGMKLVPERKIKNRAKFAQCIQQNWEYLRSIKYLTMQEKSFLLDILPNVGFLSNCLVDDVTKKSPIPLTQKDIADLLGTNKSKISKIVRSLMNKGIIARSETGIEGNNVRAYALFINPNIIFSGDKDAVNPTLKAMFSRVPKELNKLPEKLF